MWLFLYMFTFTMSPNILVPQLKMGETILKNSSST